jgi:hypothetical protein
VSIATKFANKNEVHQALLEKLEDSGLDDKDAKKLGFVPTIAEKAATLPLPAAKAGFVIPYFDLKGRKTSFWRFRYLETVKDGFTALTNRKDLRYAQAPKTLNELYLSPEVPWAKLADMTNEALIITEGELKAACACKMGLATIGLGGVWCFKSGKQLMPLLPQFAEFKWSGRNVFVCYDSDAVSNQMILSAENALARELLKLGAQPFIVRLPSLNPPKKTGLDDFLVSEGVKAFQLILDNASPFSEAQALHELNEEIVYVEDPGLILRLDTLQRMAPRNFVDHAYATRTFDVEVQVGENFRIVRKSAAKEWLKWPHRAAVRRTTYAPGQEKITENGELNIWSGWGCRPVEGTVAPFRRLLDYLFAEASPENRKWLEQWLAYPLQHPGAKLASSVVVWGLVQGTGKTLLGHTMFKIYGNNATEITDQALQSGDNDWAENKQFVMGDEITGGDKRSVADRMKSMITQKQLRINVKYVPKFTVPDCINYYFTSNHPDAFFLEDTDRRFFIHEVCGVPLPDAFYKEYMAWLEKSGAHALFHYLLGLDLTGFNPQGHAPMTQSKQNMIDDGKSDVAMWVAQLKLSPETVLRLGDEPILRDLWTCTELHGLYDPMGNKRVTINGLSRELRRAGLMLVYKGMGVPTMSGCQKLWAVRNAAKYEKITNGPELGRLYNAERGHYEKASGSKRKF